MMKTLAVLYFALALSTTALPQQPTEWRPSIAEDNKAATWEDTSLFMVNSLETHGHNYLTATTRDYVVIEKNIRIPNRCSLSYVTWSWAEKTSVVRTGTDTLDFKSIDPLSVKVTVGSNFDGGTSLWLVRMSGTSEGAIGSFVGAIHHHVHGYGGPSSIKPELLETSCQVGQKDCEPSSKTFFTDIEYFDEQEIAKRFARAVFHAALLCGGTKAVSPF